MNLIQKGDEGLRPLVGDLNGQTLVLAHTKLHRRYQLPRFQIFNAIGGFGCQENSLGRAVFGHHPADGENARWSRNDFIGIATAELVARAMADVTPVEPVNLAERCFLLVSADGNYVMGDTPTQAMERLRRITKAKVMHSFIAHPETQINEIGLMTWPEGAAPAEVKLKKKGGAWIAES